MKLLTGLQMSEARQFKISMGIFLTFTINTPHRDKLPLLRFRFKAKTIK